MRGKDALADSTAPGHGASPAIPSGRIVAQHKPVVPMGCSDCPVRHTTVCRPHADRNLAAVQRLKMEDRIVRARYKVIDEGVSSDYVYNVLDGWLAVVATAPSGHRQILDILMPGAFAGFDMPRPDSPQYGLETLTNASLCVFSKHDFRDAVRQDMLLLDSLAATLAHQRDRLLIRVDLMGRGGARQRVAFLLLDLFDQALTYSPAYVDGTNLYLPLTQNDLADACGLTNVRLNHVLRALQRDGIIDYHGKMFEFTDRRELEHVAGVR